MCVLVNRFEFDDRLIGAIGCLSKGLASFVYAFAPTEFIFYLGIFPKYFNMTYALIYEIGGVCIIFEWIRCKTFFSSGSAEKSLSRIKKHVFIHLSIYNMYLFLSGIWIRFLFLEKFDVKYYTVYKKKKIRESKIYIVGGGDIRPLFLCTPPYLQNPRFKC